MGDDRGTVGLEEHRLGRAAEDRLPGRRPVTTAQDDEPRVDLFGVVDDRRRRLALEPDDLDGRFVDDVGGDLRCDFVALEYALLVRRTRDELAL